MGSAVAGAVMVDMRNGAVVDRGTRDDRNAPV
jgi:hypothetical protein